jgi:hypothetical protein
LRDAVDRDGGLAEQVVEQGQRLGVLGVLGDIAAVRASLKDEPDKFLKTRLSGSSSKTNRAS